MSEYNEQTNKLIPFFRNLATCIENNELTLNQLRHCGDMFMMYNFNNEVDQEMLNESEIQKYLFTGWYVQTNLQKNSNENPQND